MSKSNLEVKIRSVMNIIWEECKKFIISIVSSGEFMENVFNFNNG